MPRMLELVQQAAVPASVMQSAARGGLALPSAEMLEVVVHMASMPVWSEQAKLTLAAWDECDLQAQVRNQETSVAVLRYFLEPANVRPTLLPALIENSEVPLAAIERLARNASAASVPLLLTCPRVQTSVSILKIMADISSLGAAEAEQINRLLAGMDLQPPPAEQSPYTSAAEKSEFELRFAAEIAAAEGMPFSLVEASEEESSELLGKPDEAVAGRRFSVLQNLARLSVAERVKVAMRGARDERFILIRDISRVVALAVLESPKVSDTEMEAFASMRNVTEDVLRAISRNRRFMKHYGVIRALVNNPRTPLDIGLALLPHLMVMDLRSLNRNRNVNEMISKTAIKLCREKNERNKGRD